MDELISKRKREIYARDEAIYQEYNDLMSTPNAMSTVVTEQIKAKYNICANSTIWSILKKVRLRKEPNFAKQVFEKRLETNRDDLSNRDDMILKDFNQNMLVEGVNASMVYQALQDKYGIARPTLFQAIKRAKIRSDPAFRQELERKETMCYG